MNATEIRKLQNAQMEILDEVHRICVENGIRYYLVGGSALGAVRHQGFIPWDNDMDIAMLRGDYDRFKEVCNTELNDRYSYRDFTNTKDLRHGHALVCMKNTCLIARVAQYNPHLPNMEIFIDIFPLDNVPAGEKERRKQAKKLHYLKLARYYKTAMCYDDNIIRACLKKMVSKLMFWTSIHKLNVKNDKIMRQYSDTDSGYVCSMSSGGSYYKQCLPAEVFGTPRLMPFDGRSYFAPEQVEVYLTRMYNDYMKIPSESEQLNCMNMFTECYYNEEDVV